uniref:CCHC-type domain-containing protein n=1 Tax=Anopheles coluzzii TaxID=1518534 RepID=A0A8W7PZW7_ANOCL
MDFQSQNALLKHALNYYMRLLKTNDERLEEWYQKQQDWFKERMQLQKKVDDLSCEAETLRNKIAMMEICERTTRHAIALAPFEEVASAPQPAEAVNATSDEPEAMLADSLDDADPAAAAVEQPQKQKKRSKKSAAEAQHRKQQQQQEETSQSRNKSRLPRDTICITPDAEYTYHDVLTALRNNAEFASVAAELLEPPRRQANDTLVLRCQRGEALLEQHGVTIHPDSVLLRKLPSGLQRARLLVDARDAPGLIGKRLRVGLVTTTLRADDRSPPDEVRCYRCMERGHTSRECTGVDRSRRCFRCGSGDHWAATCNRAAKCLVCEGKHPTGASSCAGAPVKGEPEV